MRRALPAIALCLTALGGCSSVDSRIYEPGDPPHLRDGSITMRSRFLAATDAAQEVRRVKAREGAVTCELVSEERGHWVGDVPEAAWVRLWQTLLASDPFGPKQLGVELDDAKGGPYHLVRLELGSKGSEFSAQVKPSFLVFSSRDTNERIAFSSAIADLVREHATRKLDASSPAVEPPKGP